MRALDCLDNSTTKGRFFVVYTSHQSSCARVYNAFLLMRSSFFVVPILYCLIGICFLLSGCSDSGDADLTRYIHQVQLRPAKSIEPIPEFTPSKQFVFPENDKRRSPFKPAQIAKKSDTNAPNLKRMKGPLEAFPLDALKFVGTLEEGSIVWALIQDPTGMITRMQVGDYLGKNYGELLSIRNKDIRIEETIQVEGRWEKKVVVMSLRVKDS